jgi:hypothetical protein
MFGMFCNCTTSCDPVTLVIPCRSTIRKAAHSYCIQLMLTGLGQCALQLIVGASKTIAEISNTSSVILIILPYVPATCQLAREMDLADKVSGGGPGGRMAAQSISPETTLNALFSTLLCDTIKQIFPCLLVG